MRALGDKIGSSLIAQAAGVPCVAWSGSGLDVKYDKENGIPQDTYDRACVFDAKQAEAAAEKIGFPVMIKASEGGGGKGIRRVEKKEQVEAALRQVQSEVSGPVFVMRVASACRHLEVQLLKKVL
jgi:acetyl-CoA carboxylase/biotin carboxylase 1